MQILTTQKFANVRQFLAEDAFIAPLGLDLRPQHRKRYEKVHARRRALGEMPPDQESSINTKGAQE
jgi:hypothetical protein